MFKSLALVSAIASIALAQTANNTAATNPLIPSGISDGCKAFYTKLDTDSQLTSCIAALSTATSGFAPGASGSASKDLVTSTLGKLCTDTVSNACPDSLIRTTLANFFSACEAELTNKNADVIGVYETLYVLSPLQKSLCSKDDGGAYCALSGSGNNEAQGTDVSSLMASLFTTNPGALKKRAAATVVPNKDTFSSKNIAFLYASPSQDANTLCNSCTRQTLSTYTAFEANLAFAPGIENSRILSQQAPLVAAVTDKCPAGFLGGSVAAAGGLGQSGPFASSASSISSSKAVIAIAMGFATLSISFL